MKTQPKGQNRHERLRQHALGQIQQIGLFIEGSLCEVKRRGCAKPGWHLTFKQKGKTHTVYVPLDLVKEVTAWVGEYKRLRKLIRGVTIHTLGIIRRHVSNRSAAHRSHALMAPLPRRPSARS